MSAAGTWNIKIPIISQEFILALIPAGAGKLTGTMVEKGGGNRSVEIKNGSENGDMVHWEVTTPFPCEFDGQVNGDKMDGTVTASLGTTEFKGVRA